MRMAASMLTIIVALLAVAPSARASLEAAAHAVDLGVVKGGQRIEAAFELRNAGTQALEIIDIERGCGCLAPKLDQRVLRPGEKASLRFEVRTLGQAEGSHTWNATVRYRDGAEVKKLPLALRGTVRNEITVQPAVLGLFVEKSTRHEIVIRDTRATPLRVVSAEARSAGLKIAEVVRDGAATKVVVAVDADALPAGRHEGMVYIFTSDLDYEELQIPVTVTKGRRALVQLVPPQPEIHLPRGAAAGSALVRLRSLGGTPLRVAKAASDDPRLEMTFAAGPGNDATIRIQARAGAGGGGDAEAQVHADLEGGETVVIPVRIRRD